MATEHELFKNIGDVDMGTEYACHGQQPGAPLRRPRQAGRGRADVPAGSARPFFCCASQNTLTYSNYNFECQYPKKVKIQDSGRPHHLISLLIESTKG